MATVSSSSRTPRPPPHEPPSPSDDDSDDNASQSSLDEDDVNRRMTPNWCAYRTIIEARGFRLDTCKDVKQWYQEYWALQASQGRAITKELPGYLRACRGQDENELCRDDGLVSTSSQAPSRGNSGYPPLNPPGTSTDPHLN